MKKLINSIIAIAVIALLLPLNLALANGQNPYATKIAVFRSGSLKANIEKVSRRYGWKLVWTSPNDYEWARTTTIKAPSVPGILKATIKKYPLQAVFYKGNKVLLIQPRTLT